MNTEYKITYQKSIGQNLMCLEPTLPKTSPTERSSTEFTFKEDDFTCKENDFTCSKEF